jgi:YfiH family protein
MLTKKEEPMLLTPQRVLKMHKSLHVFENTRFIFGFTERQLNLSFLSKILGDFKLVQVNQIHSDIIHLSKDIKAGTEGDGIILNQRNTVAIIKTADCVPLFFWDKDFTIGGIIHVGWKGFFKGIEKKLVHVLKTHSVLMEDLYIFLGPSIEMNCYTVGEELYENFSAFPDRDDFFFRKSDKEFLMDIKKGISISLIKSGIDDHKIVNSGLCTYCNFDRFFSYRRDNTVTGRIYNFLLLK